MATTASCIESSIAASSWRRFSISAKFFPSRSAVWFSAASIAVSSSPLSRLSRAFKSPSATRRAKATTRWMRRVTRRATHAASGSASSSAIRPDQSASRARRWKLSPAVCSTSRPKTNSITAVSKTSSSTNSASSLVKTFGVKTKLPSGSPLQDNARVEPDCAGPFTRPWEARSDNRRHVRS